MSGNYVFPGVILPLFLSLLIITRFLTTFFHELGHAIPATIFTRNRVSIFIGSYGDSKKSTEIKLNHRLSFYLILNPLKWSRGMILHSTNNLSFFKKLVILVLGPLFSLILASTAIWIVYTFDFNGFIKLFTIFFLISALFDLRNLYPSDTPILLYNGNYTYCDGFQILNLIKLRKEWKKLDLAREYYNERNYNSLIGLFKDIKSDFVEEDVFHTVIQLFTKDKNYVGAKFFYIELIRKLNKQPSNSNNLSNIGIVEANLGENELAMYYFNKAVELDNRNVFALCNRGFTKNLLGKYDEALLDFDLSISIEPDFAYSYANRALSNFKLGHVENALNDISKAVSIDSKEAYAYRNLGIYYLETKKYSKAKEQLQIAYDLNKELHMIDHYLKLVENQIDGITAV